MCSLIPATYVYDHKTEQTDREHFRLQPYKTRVCRTAMASRKYYFITL